MADQVVTITYQQALSTFTWYAVEFLANLSVILIAAAQFGIIKLPKPKNNLTEETVNRVGGLGEFFKEAAGVAKSINTAISSQMPQIPDQPK